MWLTPSWIKSQFTALPIPPASSFEGGTYIVTGANSGLGLECAKHLVRLGATRVIMAVRSQTRGEEAKGKIESETGRIGVAEVWPLDLASYDSIKSFADKATTGLATIDALIENASLSMGTWTEAEGVETTIAVNVLGTFLLAMLLLPKLKQSVSSKRTPHLVIVGSGAGFTGQAGVLEAINGNIIDELNNKDYGWSMDVAR